MNVKLTQFSPADIIPMVVVMTRMNNNDTLVKNVVLEFHLVLLKTDSTYFEQVNTAVYPQSFTGY